MPESIPALVSIQGALTAISGGFNALYFAGCSTSRPARRIAFLILSVVNLGLSLQGLYWVLLTVFPDFSMLLGAGPFLLIGLLPLASSLAITALVLRQRFDGSRKG